jgi:hypothetical protein
MDGWTGSCWGCPGACQRAGWENGWVVDILDGEPTIESAGACGMRAGRNRIVHFKATVLEEADVRVSGVGHAGVPTGSRSRARRSRGSRIRAHGSRRKALHCFRTRLQQKKCWRIRRHGCGLPPMPVPPSRNQSTRYQMPCPKNPIHAIPAKRKQKECWPDAALGTRIYQI